MIGNRFDQLVTRPPETRYRLRGNAYDFLF
jgi:hypothetical protein